MTMIGAARPLPQIGGPDAYEAYRKPGDKFRSDAMVRCLSARAGEDEEADLRAREDLHQGAAEREASRRLERLEGRPNDKQSEDEPVSHATVEVRARDGWSESGREEAHHHADGGDKTTKRTVSPREKNDSTGYEHAEISSGNGCSTRKTERQQERRKTGVLLRMPTKGREYTEEQVSWIRERHIEYGKKQKGRRIPAGELLEGFNRAFPGSTRSRSSLSSFIDRRKELSALRNGFRG
ncbi:Hypothetical predicted protein [Lecanosticta acicola]|uniref:Uncharacterized protein n=1 Tax=Lecanosticta acicola TaxID=111012 RepID=A0AAI8YWD2_9PEZI|nr:Hypothetical predicted protein [Lecanosticta acicola]